MPVHPSNGEDGWDEEHCFDGADRWDGSWEETNEVLWRLCRIAGLPVNREKHQEMIPVHTIGQSRLWQPGRRTDTLLIPGWLYFLMLSTQVILQDEKRLKWLRRVACNEGALFAAWRLGGLNAMIALAVQVEVWGG